VGYSVHTWVVDGVLIAIVSLAALLDFKSQRIPNWLSFTGWYLGPVLHLLISGAPALSGSVIGLLAVLVLTFPLFVLNWMGAGDVKLMASVGALVGIDHALFFLTSIFIAGFVVAIIQLILRGVFAAYVRRYWMMLGMSMASGKPVYVEPAGTRQQVTMPYAISIAIGTLGALCIT